MTADGWPSRYIDVELRGPDPGWIETINSFLPPAYLDGRKRLIVAFLVLLVWHGEVSAFDAGAVAGLVRTNSSRNATSDHLLGDRRRRLEPECQFIPRGSADVGRVAGRRARDRLQRLAQRHDPGHRQARRAMLRRPRFDPVH